MNNETLKAPILTQLYRVLSAIIFIFAFVGLRIGISDNTPMAALLPAIAILIVAAGVALGVAEVFYHIAKIEFNTREDSNDYQMIKLLSQISKNTEKSLKDML